MPQQRQGSVADEVDGRLVSGDVEECDLVVELVVGERVTSKFICN